MRFTRGRASSLCNRSPSAAILVAMTLLALAGLDAASAARMTDRSTPDKLLFTTAASPEASPPNHIANPSVEDDATGWHPYASNPEMTVEFAWDPSFGSDGTASLRHEVMNTTRTD